MSQDKEGFADFFAASWDLCLRAVAASTGDMTLAEDQTAEALARAWGSWAKVSHHPAPRAWVVRTALNTGASWWHRRSEETALASYDIAAADSHGTGLDSALLTGLSALAAPERPPLAAITSRGRAHQRRRRAGYGGLGVTSAADGTALALSLTGLLAAAPGRSAGAIPARSASTATTGTAAFTLTSNANGTDTLTLTMVQILDPATLQRALARNGIRALVRTGTYCTSSPPAPDPRSIGVLSIRSPFRLKPGLVPAPGGPVPSHLQHLFAHNVTVINPAAMPAGTELYFGYFSSDHLLFADLIDTSSYTCGSVPPP